MAWYMFIFRVFRSNEPGGVEWSMSAAWSHLIPGPLSAASRVCLRKVEDATPGISPSGFIVAMERLSLTHALLRGPREISGQSSGTALPETCCRGRKSRRRVALAVLGPVSISNEGSVGRDKLVTGAAVGIHGTEPNSAHFQDSPAFDKCVPLSFS